MDSTPTNKEKHSDAIPNKADGIFNLLKNMAIEELEQVKIKMLNNEQEYNIQRESNNFIQENIEIILPQKESAAMENDYNQNN